ncbi:MULTISPECIES: hypothetical protein [Streptomyces]|uniref:hypothetical protein n=1 Tax=Streptomyces TaxID=1883 RepID=UPI00163D178D|nr:MULTISPECIES: hypothetical protein [Streptomyces]MBC2877719.1 hypothetical protein [Streptomyces sp. TYQ1024]UBI38625.1 hypothetical protein K7I03_20610 [Streptomyces mobaraensis]UKW31207.1 hypothetical protein MCU78_20565 [Streptomyces sp. TYQ1024]
MTPADLTHAPATDSTGSAGSPADTALRVLGIVALWVFAGLTFLILPLSVMASDGCDQGDTRTICTTAGQQAVG